VDGKLDSETLFSADVYLDGNLVHRKGKQPQHHLTFTNEKGGSSGSYLLHKTLPKKADASCIAGCVFDAVLEVGCSDSLSAILVDNTPINTGYKNGFVVKLEKLLGKPLHLIGCALHSNELPLRALFKKLDGVSNSPNSFNGPLGKAVSSDLEEMPIVNFEPIAAEAISDQPDEVRGDLSNDQRLLFEYCRIVVTGQISPWVHRKIGPLNHSRWLTLAIRLLCLYTRSDAPSTELRFIVNFIVNVYGPTWFAIKRSSCLKDMPQILFDVVRKLTCYEDDVELLSVIKKTIQRNAYCLLSNNFIYSLIASSEVEVRNIGWKYVLEARRSRKPKFSKKTPSINWQAEHWTRLVPSQELSLEPNETMRISDDLIERYITTGQSFDLPSYPSHSQSVERSVQLVSTASRQFYGEESRHRSILCKLLSRELRPVFQSKGSYQSSYEELFV